MAQEGVTRGLNPCCWKGKRAAAACIVMALGLGALYFVRFPVWVAIDSEGKEWRMSKETIRQKYEPEEFAPREGKPGFVAVEGETGLLPPVWFVDEDGEVHKDKEFVEARPFSEGLAAVAPAMGKAERNSQQDGAESLEFRETVRWGFLDTAGDIVIDPQYKRAGDFAGGRAFVRLDEREGAYIDDTGHTVIEGVRWGTGFHKGVAIAEMARDDSNASATLLIDRAGHVLDELPAGVSVRGRFPNNFNNGYVVARNNDGRCGYLTHRGEWAIEAAFALCLPFRHGVASVVVGDGFDDIDKRNDWRLINTDGRFVTQSIYAHPLSNTESYAFGERQVNLYEWWRIPRYAGQ